MFASCFLIGHSLFACVGGCPDGVCIPASYSFEVPEHARATITADTLKNLMNSNVKVLLIEYRKSTQTEDISIPGATIITDEFDSEQLAQLLPVKKGLIIVYPGRDGAAVDELVTKLHELGYDAILVYYEGLLGWLSYGYQTAGASEQ